MHGPVGPTGPGEPFNAYEADSTVTANDAVSAYSDTDADSAIEGIDPEPCG